MTTTTTTRTTTSTTSATSAYTSTTSTAYCLLPTTLLPSTYYLLFWLSKSGRSTCLVLGCCTHVIEIQELVLLHLRSPPCVHMDPNTGHQGFVGKGESMLEEISAQGPI